MLEERSEGGSQKHKAGSKGVSLSILISFRILVQLKKPNFDGRMFVFPCRIYF